MDSEDMKNGRPALSCDANYMEDMALGFALISPMKYIKLLSL